MLVGSIALTGCGRRGPLELPPEEQARVLPSPEAQPLLGQENETLIQQPDETETQP